MYFTRKNISIESVINKTNRCNAYLNLWCAKAV